MLVKDAEKELNLVLDDLDPPNRALLLSSSYFGMLSVKPENQGRGISSLLIDESLRVTRVHAKYNGQVCIVVWLQTRLIETYMRKGYKKLQEVCWSS